MFWPEVSVCITTYNQCMYIRDCLKSVIEQTMVKSMEILVGDDCSDDGTSDIISEFANNYRGLVIHLRHSSRLGPSANTQALVGLAKGKFISRLDGDDYWLPDKLSRQMDYMKSNPECSAVYTNAFTIHEDGTPLGLFNDVGSRRFDLASLLRRGNFLNNSSVLFRAEHKQAWLDIRGPLIDYRVHLLHAQYGFVAQIGCPLVVYRVNARGSQVKVENDTVRELYWQAILSIPPKLVSDLDLARGMADFLRRVIFRAMNCHQLSLVLRWASRVLNASPCGVVTMAVLTLGAVVRAMGVELRGLVQKRQGGSRLVVLYRR